MIRITNMRMSLDGGNLYAAAAKLLHVKESCIERCTMIRKAVDARHKNDVHYVCTVDVQIDNETEIVKRINNRNVSLINVQPYTFPDSEPRNDSPLIVGAGPAGLFCALVLAEHGHHPILIERGKPVKERMEDVQRFWKGGKLNPQSNVQFGEGGAGTFSDGKLTTGIKDTCCRYVLEQFVKYGAPEDILYLAKPHIGTDNLCVIVENIRNRIIECGGQVCFSTQLTGLEIKDGRLTGAHLLSEGRKETLPVQRMALAIGHSARDTFAMLKETGIAMTRKPFSVGARIEHKQEMINIAQYGDVYQKLGAADYKFAVHLPDGRSVYTFCMCPGGIVVASASEADGVVTNGMSYYNRNGENANSALLVEVRPDDLEGEDVLAGVWFQKEIEQKAFIEGGRNYHAPAQTVGDFLKNKSSVSLGEIVPTYRPSITPSNIRRILPSFVTNAMAQAIPQIDKKMKGFAAGDAVLTVPETRSSSPVRIVRDASKQASVLGLYPCGEGAGYAGGIMSAAVDGIRIAEAMTKNISCIDEKSMIK